MLVEMILGSVVPAAVDMAKQFITGKMGGVKATTVKEQIELDQNEIEKLKAVAALDNPGGTPSQWVIDLRASARYVMAGVVILTGISIPFVQGVPEGLTQLSFEAANIAFGFLFGSRIVSGWKK